jgi:hypothetical protein
LLALKTAAPALQRVGDNREGRPPILREEPADGGEEGPVGGRIAGPLPPPGEDPQLISEHGDLQLPIVDARADEQAKQAAQEAIQGGARARARSYGLPGLATTPHVGGPIEFIHPTGSIMPRSS